MSSDPKGPVSASERRSLELFEEYGAMSPSAFANVYFASDHPGWERIAKCGPYGSTKGGGLVLWAGGWFGKLRAKGYIQHQSGYNSHFLTAAGRKVLEVRSE